MNANEIISQRKNYPMIGGILALLGLFTPFIVGLLRATGDFPVTIPKFFLWFAVAAMVVGFSLLAFNTPETQTIINIQEKFALKHERTIQGDLNSTQDQTIIFTGVKNNEYSNFTATIKDGIFTLTQHDPANIVSLAPVNK